MVMVNYFIAILLSQILFDVDVLISFFKLPYLIIIALSFLLPCIFFALHYSIQNVGIIKTDLAQRLSLIIPLIASLLIFNDTFSLLRCIGLGLGLLAVFLIIQSKSKTVAKNNKNWIAPLLVFFGFGVIDVLFKQVALYTNLSFTTTLFFTYVFSFCVTVCIFIFKAFNKKESFIKYSIYFGIPLGLLNFSNIYFYLLAHQEFNDSPTTVFAGMNFGVIIIGTLVGYFAFKESLTKRTVIGLTLALVAITILVMAQMK